MAGKQICSRGLGGPGGHVGQESAVCPRGDEGQPLYDVGEVSAEPINQNTGEKKSSTGE